MSTRDDYAPIPDEAIRNALTVALRDATALAADGDYDGVRTWTRVAEAHATELRLRERDAVRPRGVRIEGRKVTRL